jgi:hypothetical protein
MICREQVKEHSHSREMQGKWCLKGKTMFSFKARKWESCCGREFVCLAVRIP